MDSLTCAFCPILVSEALLLLCLFKPASIFNFRVLTATVGGLTIQLDGVVVCLLFLAAEIRTILAYELGEQLLLWR